MKNKLLTILFITTIILVTTHFEVEGYNYEFVNVTTRVNVTNSPPEILAFFIEDPVILSAGSTKTVYCNATIRDWNGFNDILNVNASFYYIENSTGPEHNDVFYFNESCVETSNDGAFIANYSCAFDVWFYAQNGTWVCNMTVESSADLMDNNFTTTTIDPLYALNVTSVIDYGNLTVTETSTDVIANVTNFGNTFVNVSVQGYGATEGDGLGLVCQTGDNITVENQRFAIDPAIIWDDKTPLQSTDQDMGFTLDAPRLNNLPVVRSTYWQLFVPPNPFGECTGTVRFTATIP